MINDVKDDEDKEKKEITSSYHWRDVSVSARETKFASFYVTIVSKGKAFGT